MTQPSQNQVLELIATLSAAKVGIEACATAHYWAREIVKSGDALKKPRMATKPLPICSPACLA